MSYEQIHTQEFTTMTWIILSTAVSLIIIYCCLKIYKRCNYWKINGIPHLKPLPFLGNFLEVVLLKKSVFDLYKEIYSKFPNERVVGVYELFWRPVLLVRDLKLIEKILVKDFQYFNDHPQISNNGGIFTSGLFQLRGLSWRLIRHKIIPAFTAGKMKDMFLGMLGCTEEMLSQIEQNLNKDYVLREAVGAFVTDVITNTVFGIKINDKNTRDKFIRLGTTIFNVTPLRFFHLIALSLFPNAASWLGIKFLDSETEDYFNSVISLTLKQRENTTDKHNDFTQQLLSLKQLGNIEIKSKDQDDEYLNLNSAASTENIELTDSILAGQAFQFYSAGFDPVLLTITYVLYDLCRYPEIQERVRKHINEKLDEHQGYTYECLKDMTLLEQCMQETLRFYPIGVVLTRECTKSYYIPEEKLIIYKGQKVIIPVNAIHFDPKYYSDPEVYNPERFPPNTFKLNFSYLPFGEGPRICIGIRFATVVIKLGLAKLLTNYKFKLSPNAEVPFSMNKLSPMFMPKNDILFNVSKI